MRGRGRESPLNLAGSTIESNRDDGESIAAAVGAIESAWERYVAGFAEITRRAREIDAAVPCPWVVLSQGVAVEDFPPAVDAACRAGASGFLAGRAIWSDSITADGDLRRRLDGTAVPRLQALSAVVDALARPVPARTGS